MSDDSAPPDAADLPSSPPPRAYWPDHAKQVREDMHAKRRKQERDDH